MRLNPSLNLLFRPRLEARFSFPNCVLGEFGTQNNVTETVTETGSCLGTKMNFEKLGLQCLQTLRNWGY